MKRIIVGVGGALALTSCSLAGGQVGSAPPVPAGATRGGILTVGIVAPGGIDPLDSYEPAGKLVSSAMCDTVVAIDPVTGQLREALAKGWVESDGSQVTVKLRHGVTFNDGSQLTSKDVNYSLQQLVAPSNAAYESGLALQFAGEAVLKANSGQTDLLADPDDAADIASGVSNYDFQVSSIAPDGGSLRAFAEPAMAPTSKAASTANPSSAGVDPVCVGPYKLAAPYKSGDTEIRLVRTKNYYGQNNGYTGGGSGYADEIDLTVYKTSAAALAGYDSGAVDVVQVPQDQVVATDPASRVYGLATGVEYVGLPGDPDGPFADADVRVALSQAIDRGALASTVFGPAAQVATGFEPPALAISRGPSLEGKVIDGAPLASCGDTTPAAPDLAAARANLAAAAAKPGAKPLTGFTLEVNQDAPYPALAAALAAQWKSALGLDVTVVTMPWATYAAQGTGAAGIDTPFRIRWSTDAGAPEPTYNDPQSYLSGLFDSASTQAANWAHWSDRDYQQDASDAASVTDVAQRGIAYAKVSSVLCAQMPIIPLVFERPTYLVRSTDVGSARAVPVGRDGVLLLRELYKKGAS